MDVWSLPQSEEEAVKLLLIHGTLYNQRTCNVKTK